MVTPFGCFLLRTSAIRASSIALGLASVCVCTNLFLFIGVPAVKYTRKKINDGTLEDWKKEQFLEVAGMRDMEEHTGGKRKLGIQEIRKLGI